MRTAHRHLAPAAAALLGVAAVVLGAGTALGQGKGGRVNDRFWTVPDYAAHGARSIAVLQPTSYSNDVNAEKIAEGEWAQALRGLPYRWVNSSNTNTLLRRTPAGDSLLQLARRSIYETGRVDSLLATPICRILRVQGLLSLHLDRWEQYKLEFNQSGYPTTTVTLKSALVDSTGRLLWTGTGTQVSEGPFQDPNAHLVGVKSSGLNPQPIQGQGGPPTYAETLKTMLARWVPQFPPLPPAPAPADSAKR
jgi:hypothetical protein